MNNAKRLARWKVVALLIVVALLLVGCGDVRRGTSWPMMSVLTVEDQIRVVVAYENQIEMIDPVLGRPVGLTDDNGNALLNESGESLRWVISGSNFENATFFTAPLVNTLDEQTQLAFATYNNRLLMFDAVSAQVADPVGATLTDGVVANLVTGDGLIYVPYRSSDLVALDAETYAEVWRLDTLEGVWASPVLHEGVLYVASIDHFLYAVDAATGETIWSVDLEGAIASSPLLYDGHLYVGTYAHKFYKVSLDGEVIASYEGSNWVWSTPVVYDGVMYYTDLGGKVYALDAVTMTPVWIQTPATRGIRPAPIVTEEYVIVASRNGRVYWLNRESGALIFEREIPNQPEVLSEMLVLDANEAAGLNAPLLLVASVQPQNLLTAYTLDTGEQKWVYGR